jgi:beta-lactamase superfamily II metal-dependent hydrolase
MLIDCGVLLGTPNAKAVMGRVGEDILAATGGHLDVLVVTHEHWDHVSGFSLAREQFEQLDVDKVWFAWTEDPDNSLARELRTRRQTALSALQESSRRLQAGHSPLAEPVAALAAFFGPSLGAGGRASTEDILQWVKDRWPNHEFCTPSQPPLTLPGVPDVRCHVLGPPKDVKLLRKSRPSQRQSEVYLSDRFEQQFAPLLTGLGRPIELRFDAAVVVRDGAPGMPFDPAYALDVGAQVSNEHYPQLQPMLDRYLSEDWRRIDDNWLDMTAELALKLDEHTNNTSVVLAIELGAGGQVLLFPGDAQVGNWLSWFVQEWTDGDRTVSAADLLARAVLYKVGHHGSHNATLRDGGLELMTDPRLAALIPVGQETAAKQGWAMPHGPLLERLLELTAGRVILADEGVPSETTGKGWKDFLASVQQTDLYIDVTITNRTPPGSVTKAGPAAGKPKRANRPGSKTVPPSRT